MRPKHAILLILLFVYAVSGCAFLDTHRAEITQTAAILGKRAGAIALQVVISAATSPADARGKQDYLDSLGGAFRAYQDAHVLIDGRDIEAIVTLWTPAEKQHWQALAKEFSTLWDQHRPTNQAEVNAFLEAYARAVQSPEAP